MIRPRWLARLLAWMLGYFWLPCPSCGQMFAGFESGVTFVTDRVSQSGRIVSGWTNCKRCDGRVFQETVKAHACRPLRLRACEVGEVTMNSGGDFA